MNTDRNIIAIDTETFYSKEYTIRDLGNYGYVHHPEFDPYMLTAAVEDGEWVGRPTDFVWDEANDQIWIMANAGFDLAVIERLIEQGRIPKVKPFAVYDVLDLARYLGFPGNLAGACEHMLGVTMDKSTRGTACGKHWEDMTPDFQKEMSEYAVRDARYTLQLFLKFQHLWPEWERELSRMTREMCADGVPLDVEGVRKDIEKLKVALWRVRSMIPWSKDSEAKILSKKEVAIECRKHNVEPPKSMAKDSEEFEAWLKRYGDKFQWAKAMGSYRSMNMLLKKLESMLLRARPDGVMVYGLKYAGAHTLRDSGDAGVNVQNFPRNPMFESEMREFANVSTEKDETGKYVIDPEVIYGIDMRGKIMAPEGFELGVVDLSAIEPCCTAFLAEDWNMVELLTKGMDPYEAWARVHHNYKDSRPLKIGDPKLRQLCKVEVLGLGYGAGPDKLMIIAQMLANLTLSKPESEQIVTGFRATKFIPRLWNKLETGMKASAGGDFQMGLPSGRNMLYRQVKNLGKLSAIIPRAGKMMRLSFWGGTLTENLVQATARDVFMDRAIELHKAGLPPIMRVHDEAVCLLKSETAQDDLNTMIKIMSTAPAWGQDIPVRADGHCCKRYAKQ